MLKPKLFSILKHRDTELSKEQLLTEISSGLIVAVVALPLSIALAIASGVTPEKGLITAIIAGFIISSLGGSRVQIGGPTGAFVIIVYGIVMKYGVAGLTVATIMAGIFMIIFGLLRFGSVIKYVPYPTTTGFTSGIAIVLLSGEISDFFGMNLTNIPAEFFEKWNLYFHSFNQISISTTLIGLLTILIIIFWPKINKKIPSTLIALIVSTLLVKFLNLPVETIGSRFGSISNKISFINLADLNISFDTFNALLRPAISIAFLASVESLLSAVVADGMIGKKHNSNMELIAQGIANVTAALFGGIPATGAIARTATNIKNGARTPISGIVHAITLLLIMLVFMPYAALIPMTTLASILIIVAYNMSEWRSFKALLKSTKSDAIVLIVTFTMTIVFDLVVAIEIGMLIAMLLFVKRMAETTQAANISSDYVHLFNEDDDEYNGNKSFNDGHHIGLNGKIMIYEISGPLFFGAANTFLEVMNEVRNDTDFLILKMDHVPNMDATALDTLERILKTCRKEEIHLLIAGLNEQPTKLLETSKFIDEIKAENLFETIEDAIKYSDDLIIKK